jgi:DNA replication protein DnaC
MTDNLQIICKQLHISGVYQYLKETDPHDPGIYSFLESACQCELDTRMQNRRMKTLKQAGFPTQKRFDDLVLEMLPEDGKASIQVLRQLEFIEQHRNIILIGNSGTGKTHLAIATGVWACQQNVKVLFRTAAGLVNELREAKREGRLTFMISQMKKVDLLILDELGYITFDNEGAELLFHLLATRYETLSTIITTNLPFSEWVKLFHDKTLTAALLDRITHRAIVLNMNGTSFRRK